MARKRFYPNYENYSLFVADLFWAQYAHAVKMCDEALDDPSVPKGDLVKSQKALNKMKKQILALESHSPLSAKVVIKEEIDSDHSGIIRIYCWEATFSASEEDRLLKIFTLRLAHPRTGEIIYNFHDVRI